MPEVFQCSEFPCKGGMESEDNVSFDHKLDPNQFLANLDFQTVTCYIAAPIQRTVFINLHFGATVCTMFLAMLDIYSIVSIFLTIKSKLRMFRDLVQQQKHGIEEAKIGRKHTWIMKNQCFSKQLIILMVLLIPEALLLLKCALMLVNKVREDL